MNVLDKKNIALFSGISLVVMALAAGFSAGYIPGKFILEGDPTGTIYNLESMTELFRMNLLGWFIIVIADLIVSWGVYVLFKKVDDKLALLSGMFRFFYTVFLVIAVTFLLKLVTVESLEIRDLVNIEMFNAVWSMGLIIFALHLLTLGVLMLKTDFIPKVFSVLMLIAAVGYLLIQTLDTFFPGLGQIQTVLEYILVVPMTVGELAFAIFLIGKRKSFL